MCDLWHLWGRVDLDLQGQSQLLLQERGLALVQSPCAQLGLLFFPSSPPKTQNSLRAFSVLDSNDGQAASHIGAKNFLQVLAPTSREGR